jgi:hypothetical protein
MIRAAGAYKAIAGMVWGHTSFPTETGMKANSEATYLSVTVPCIVKTVKALRESGSGEDQT